MKKRFPLAPLVSKKRDEVERRARELALAERRAASEKAALAKARAERLKAAERASAEAGRERARLEEGIGRVQDLTRAELYRVREAARVEALGRVERRAGERSEAAEREVGDARSVLGGARADSQALEKHERRWEGARARAAEVAEEEAAHDAHSVARRRPKG